MIESPRHSLDEAIDRVAAKLVEVPADDELLKRTMAQLPVRLATPWFLTLPAQAMTAAALLLLAFVYASPSREQAPRESLPATALAIPPEAHPLEAVARPVAAPIPVSRSLSLIPDPRSPIPDPRSPIPDPRSPIPDPRSPIPDRPDHEHSLTPVDTLPALALDSIEPKAIAPDATAALAPLVVTELTLASESSLREQK